VGYIVDGDVLNTGKPNIKGVTPEFKYERFNFRSNFDFTITKTTQLGINLSGYVGKRQSPGGNYANIMSGLMTANPNQPLPIYSDGVYGGGDPGLNVENAYKSLMSLGTKISNRNSFNSDFELKQQLDFIIKGLSFKGRFSFDNYFNTEGRNINDDGLYTSKYWDRSLEEWVYTTPASLTGFDFVPTPLTYTNEIPISNVLRNIYYEFGLMYNRTFNSHRVGAMALMSRENFVTGNNWPSKREDWVSRITYDYKGKYLFELNGAYNGSAKFGPNYRFDFFPSFAVGWRISEENIVRNNFPQLTNLKIKYSIGKIGSDNFNGLGMWPYITSYVNNPDELARFGNGALMDTPYNVAFREGTPGNPDLMWETARKQDFGLEFELFDGIVTGGADYFDEYRYNMLIAAGERSIPDYYGATPSAANIGKVNSNGLELEIKLQKKFGKVNIWAAGNWTKAVNKIIYKEDPILKPAYQKNEGYSIGQNRKYVVDDIIQSWDEMYTGVLFETAYINNTNLIPGDFRMVDFNADGKINTQDVIPYQYTTYPQNTYGFSFGGEYSGFTLNLQFYGTYNTSLEIERLSRFEFLESKPVVYPEQLSTTFTPEYGNINSTYHSFNLSRSDGSYNGSAFLYDASILRLKTAEISYNLPKKMLSKLNIDRCRLYLNGNNLFFWSDLPYDVEGVALDYRNYPTTKLYNFGLQLTF
jgi:TonB-linked SusC/RagA family outer membrane protein